ncbi:MAG: DUF2244 domain-containing protein [Paracoccaceae bacterium]|nr:DUF2244 domain-containing protein [Paracoccaceae bacterium]MDE3237786.1 DUF2244 domain-containing protein [Paracoccaceae bacterium]
MPYEWVRQIEEAPEKSGAFSQGPGNPAPRPWTDGDLPVAELHLWPNRSLPRGGFVLIIAATAALFLVPLLALVGSPELWGVLPFAVLTGGGLWLAFRSNYRSGKLIERLRLWPNRIEINRHEPDGRQLDWTANPHWIRIALHAEGGPVEQYLTLKGSGREVELGAFLSPEERVALKDQIERAIARL